MLKIRKYDDNGNPIYLKELENFGFKYNEFQECWIGGDKNRELHLKIYEQDTRYAKAREIKMYEPFRDNEDSENNLELVYDLMKANLVEKR